MSDWIEKAKDFIKGHPDQAGQGIDKAEELINERTDGTYADQLDQGTDKVREGLGLPPEAEDAQSVPAPAPTPEPAPTPAPTPEPAPTPTPEPGPAPTPEPAPVDPVDPAPIDPSLPGDPGSSEIPPTGEPAGEHDLPGVPDPNLPGGGQGDITLGNPPQRP
jgi:hypothetical protein